MKASQQFWHLLRTADKHGWIPFPLTRGHGLKASNDVWCDADGLMTNWRLMSRYAARRRSTCTWPIHFYLRDYKSAAASWIHLHGQCVGVLPSQGYLLIDFYAARSTQKWKIFMQKVAARRRVREVGARIPAVHLRSLPKVWQAAAFWSARASDIHPLVYESHV